MKKLLILFALTLLAGATPLHAHYLWIETPQEEAGEEPAPVRLYYGEYEEGAREVAGGRLDEVTPVRMWFASEGGEKVNLDLEKRDDHFAVRQDLPAGNGLVEAVETGRPVQDWARYGIGVVKPLYYTGTVLDPASGIPEVPGDKTRLAVYPLELGEESRVQVFFEGSVLPGAKVNVHAPNEWSKTWRTDEQGIASVTLPWPGLYVFEVIHKVEEPGEFEGVDYEALRHRATFTYERASGA